MAAAEELFTETFRRFNNNWNVILSLRQFVAATGTVAPLALKEYHAGIMDLASTDSGFRKIFGDADRPANPEVLAFLQTQMTALVLNNASAAIDAASLVFAQSIVDDAAWSYLKVSAIVDPAAWETMFEDKKVSFKDAQAKTYEDIRAEFIDAKLKQIGRESLLTKIDLLFKLCTPPKDYAPMNNYSYDRARIEKIDGQRHSMIHENGFGTALPTLAEDLEYLSRTAWFLMGLLNQRHNLKIDMRQFFNLQTATPTEIASLGS
jgi:hypothetical protein